MASEEKENSKGSGNCSGYPLVESEVKERHGNGFAIAAGNGVLAVVNSTGSSGEGLRTYSRRKRAKMVMENGTVAWGTTSQVADQSLKEPWDKSLHRSSCTQASLTPVDPLACVNDMDGASLKHWRNVVLEQMSHTLECEGGLRGCIQDAVQSRLTTAVKESVHSCKDGSKCTSQTGTTLNRLQNEVNCNMCLESNGSMHESNRHSVTELCQRTFHDVVTSEKFAQLCQMLLQNFPGVKAEKFLDISIINSRMKEGAYESSPNLFLSDVQQVWTKVHRIGTDMASLAKSLSDKSRTSFREQFFAQEPVIHDKVDHTEAWGVYKVCSCRHCGEKADGRNCLVCDSCEEMYHVSCIEPAVKEIPLRSWYCANCTAKGIGSPHDDCVVCERLNAPRSPNHGADQELKNEEMVSEFEESSNGLADDDLQLNGEASPTCVVCRTAARNDEKLKICRHAFCPHKFYHLTCLTRKQIHTYGPSWYCPSCLCRSCLTDRDDDKIVLCDGCDHAYHIYCMQPPRTSIPRGKWFCRICDAEIRLIRKAKNSHENMHHRLKRMAVGGKGSNAYPNGKPEEKEKDSDALDKSGGMDMLLSAAKSLNYEEDMAALGLRS